LWAVVKNKYHHPRKLFLLASAGLVSVTPILAQEEAAKEPAPLDVSKLNLAELEYMFPAPGEILVSLKAANPDVWKSVTAAAANLAGSADDEASAALLLGAAVADCFLAIETEDSALFEKRSTSVLEAAKKLGAEEPLMEAGSALVKMAKDGEWDAMLGKLDELHTQTIEAMRKIGDDDAEAICLASGWVRGLALYSEGLLADYSEEGTLVLRQGELLQQLNLKLDKISDSAKEHDGVKKLSAALAKLPAAMPEGKEDTLTKEKVAELNAIAKSAI